MHIHNAPKFSLDFSLSGKSAMVTGASIGIGRVVAEFLSAKGANVILLDRTPGILDVARKIERGGGAALPMIADVTDLEAVKTVIAEGWDAFGRIDILVNNAALCVIEDAVDFPDEAWDASLAVNLTAPMRISREIGRMMIQDGGGGRMINIASQASVIALGRQVAYCATKAGLVHMSKVLAYEWAEHKVTVNCVSPSFVYTDTSWEKWATDDTHNIFNEEGNRLREMVPMKRMIDPVEVAAAVAFYASDAASMITGTNLVIDGAFTII